MTDINKLKKTILKLSNKVYETLQEGYNESVYEEALAVELRRNKIKYSVERNVEVMYENERVGIDRLDFLVEEKLVVELKAAASISKGNKAQLAAYLRVLKLKDGLLINFPYPIASSIEHIEFPHTEPKD